MGGTEEAKQLAASPAVQTRVRTNGEQMLSKSNRDGP